MKNRVLLISFLFILCVMGCKEEEPIGQDPVDAVAPGAVTNPEVKNVPGGAVIYYQPPRDEDLLYVKASYTLKDGVVSEVRSSLYSDSVYVQGFGDTQPREVKIVAVDRSKNESQPATVSIQPLEPPVVTIGKTLQLVPDFGGVHAYWENPGRAEISVVLLVEDNNKDYVPLETFYSSARVGDAARREMDTIPTRFRVYVQDRWENRSPVQDYTYTPIFEKRLDRLKFKEVRLPNDVQTIVGGWSIPALWDDVTGVDNNGLATQINQPWPHSFTIDLGALSKISRLRLFQRINDAYIFAEGNPRKFEVWGSAEYEGTGDWDKWIKLMDCSSIKPSGLPILQFSQEDKDRAINGEDFVCPPTNPKVRYLRINVTQTWSGTRNFQICELQIYGDDRNK